MTERSLVIKVTAGKEDPERCNQAFTVAAAAVASGVPVSLWLTGESAWFALPGRAEDFSLPHAAPLADLLAGIMAAGTVTLCTQCAARRNIAPADLINGIRISGAATFVAEIMTNNAQALVYLTPPATPMITKTFGPVLVPKVFVIMRGGRRRAPGRRRGRRGCWLLAGGGLVGSGLSWLGRRSVRRLGGQPPAPRLGRAGR
jgi:predicted peroxiredoxin